MTLGYARVSSEDECLDLRRARLKEGACGKLFEEKIFDAARQQRPAWSGNFRTYPLTMS
jgi:hypothetical protein